MKGDLERCLEDLEQRLDPEVEAALFREWVEFSEGRFRGEIYSPRRSRAAPSGAEWPRPSVNAAIDDFDAMALQQYAGVSDALAQGNGSMPNVRANYGTGILPSLFGAEIFRMEEGLNTLPTTRPFGDRDAIRRLVDAGVPDFRRGLGPRVLEMGERFQAIGRRYPKIGRWVSVYHPDVQGPMDACEMIWGSEIFYALHDEPELVHRLLSLVTDTYAAFLRAWARIAPFRPECNAHWGILHKGRIMLRDDSAMNLSPEMFDAFVRPYDQRLLDAFGGGAGHFCGRGDHFIASLCQMKGFNALAMSQPHLNDMEIIYRNTVDKGVILVGFSREWAEKARAAGRPLHGRVHCAE